jgi:hypothetical protein
LQLPSDHHKPLSYDEEFRLRMFRKVVAGFGAEGCLSFNFGPFMINYENVLHTVGSVTTHE